MLSRLHPRTRAATMAYIKHAFDALTVLELTEAQAREVVAVVHDMMQAPVSVPASIF